MITAPYVTVIAVRSGVDAVAQLPPITQARKLNGLNINGPKDASFVLYIGQMTPSARVDATAQGTSNTADYSNPLPIPAGSYVYAVWPGQAANATQCNVTFRLQ